MTNARLKNVLFYSLIALLNLLLTIAVLAMGAGTLVGFRPGEVFAPYTPAFVSIITTLNAALTTWLAANRPRVGSEKLASQVKALQDDGLSRADMTVVPTEDIELLKAEAARIRRVRPLRDVAAADEALERQRG